MCRNSISSQDIHATFNGPSLLDSYGQRLWAYEGRGGWWLYDPEANSKIIERGESKSVSIDIAGETFIIDFEQLIQYSEKTKRTRKIKMITQQDTIKGIAGLKMKTEARSGVKD